MVLPYMANIGPKGCLSLLSSLSTQVRGLWICIRCITQRRPRLRNTATVNVYSTDSCVHKGVTFVILRTQQPLLYTVRMAAHTKRLTV